ncbi:uncharacterized protein LOC131955808 [Physella acuta]|uniref:uncharacterized protein LOC131955808 n=1 Tax=Physella acuta TaxID=109671 RepID=UPI0027DD9CB4|nr:uncharacterized protein LOC131955808 [Physella acuta]
MLLVTASFLLFICCTALLGAQDAPDSGEVEDDNGGIQIPEAIFYVFDFSDEFNYTTYILSKPLIFNADYNISQDICGLVWSRLAAIDNSENLKFVASFLDTFPDVTKVYIDAERTNKKWVDGTGEEVLFFDWAKGSPKQENCIVLTKATGWKMEDYSCTYKGGDPRFLCEYYTGTNGTSDADSNVSD